LSFITSLRVKDSTKLAAAVGREVENCLNKIQGVYLCGGALTSYFSNTEIRDLDIYFNTEEALNLTKRANFLKFYDLVIETNLSITYRKKESTTGPGFPIETIQLIKLDRVFKKKISEILDCFDFTVCKCGYDFKNKTFSYDESFFIDLAKKELNLGKRLDAPMHTLCRVNKYIKRGFFVTNQTLFKLGVLINRLDLKNSLVLKTQLEGLGSGELKALGRKVQDSITGFEFLLDNEAVLEKKPFNIESILSEFLDN